MLDQFARDLTKLALEGKMDKQEVFRADFLAAEMLRFFLCGSKHPLGSWGIACAGRENGPSDWAGRRNPPGYPDFKQAGGE